MLTLQYKGAHIKKIIAVILAFLHTIWAGDPQVNIVIKNSPGAVVNIGTVQPRPFVGTSPCSGAQPSHVVFTTDNPWLVQMPVLVETRRPSQPVYVPSYQMYPYYNSYSYSYGSGGHHFGRKYTSIPYTTTPYLQ